MLTRYKGKTALKSWGQKIAKRCHKKAVVAVARQARRHHARDVAGRHGLRRSAARRRRLRRRADRQGAQASGRPRMTLRSPFNRQPAFG